MYATLVYTVCAAIFLQGFNRVDYICMCIRFFVCVLEVCMCSGYYVLVCVLDACISNSVCDRSNLGLFIT